MREMVLLVQATLQWHSMGEKQSSFLMLGDIFSLTFSASEEAEKRLSRKRCLLLPLRPPPPPPAPTPPPPPPPLLLVLPALTIHPHSSHYSIAPGEGQPDCFLHPAGDFSSIRSVWELLLLLLLPLLVLCLTFYLRVLAVAESPLQLAPSPRSCPSEWRCLCYGPMGAMLCLPSSSIWLRVWSPALREVRQLALFPKRDAECRGCEQGKKRGGEERSGGGAQSCSSARGLSSHGYHHGHYKHKAWSQECACV